MEVIEVSKLSEVEPTKCHEYHDTNDKSGAERAKSWIKYLGAEKAWKYVIPTGNGKQAVWMVEV